MRAMYQKCMSFTRRYGGWGVSIERGEVLQAVLSEYVADEIWYGEQVADAGEDTSIAGTAGNLCYRWATAIA